MNIIKFKDMLLDSSCGLSLDKIEMFNNELKGKYAYAINWMHIVPLDKITQEEYVKLSLGDPLIDGIYLEMIDIPQHYIDLDETMKINGVEIYKNLNKYTTDSDITIDELRVFRPWLAHTLLQQSIKDSQFIHVLEYYDFDDPTNLIGAGMYDDVIKHLSDFTSTPSSIIDITKSSCGCKNIPVINTLMPECDAISIYRTGIYNKMVEVFSDMYFWQDYKGSILIDMKKYIDNIIKLNLPLYSSKYISNYTDCGCLNLNDLEQQNNIKILSDLSKSLQFIIDDKISGNKNFISDSLSKWASVLYEKMYWA